jgi:electron transfer flavoprotein beta subunit
MKILVCVSKTIETTERIRFTADATAFDSDGVQFIMNPYDEWYSLVRALELKEANGGTVTILNVGPSVNDTIIRKGLAIGADDAVRIDSEAHDARYVADQIAAYAADKAYDIIFVGKETIDYNGSEVGSMLAELLDIPFVSYGNHMEFADGKAQVSRDIEGGEEVVEVSVPFVISAAKGLAEQRIPNMRGIMMAKRKPLQVIPAVEKNTLVETKSFGLPPEKSEVKMIDPENMDELVRLLHEESKVI